MRVRPGMRAGGLWVALAAVMVAGACSADPGTAPTSDAASLTSTPDTASTVAAGDVTATTAAVAGAAAAPTTAPVTSASPVGGAAPTPTPTTAGGGQAGRAATALIGKGITATSVKLGFAYSTDLDAAPEGPGERVIMQSVIDHYNRNGGLAGYKIEPVWYGNSFNSGKTEAQRQQERCVTFTEDSQVFAVYPNFTTSENEVACLAKKSTLLIGAINAASAPGRFDDESYQKLPNLWAPATPSANRIFSTMVERLHAAKYFDPGARIGVIYTDEAPSRRAIERSFKPALAAKGLKVSEEAAILSPVDVKDLAPMASQIQSAVLRFRTAGITHVVIPTGLGSIIPGQFMRTSQEQGYKPRYGLESGSLGVDREPFSQTSVREQLRGAVYMGWDPWADTRDGAATTRARECNEILRKAGMPRQDPRGHATCDFLAVVEAGFERSTGDMSVAGFAAAMRKVGELPLIRTFATNYGTGRRDGGAYVRMAAYDFSCQSDSLAKSCWRYNTPPIPF